MALLFIDLDGFKLVNDVYGHARGDILLAEAAARLSEVASGSEQVARLGGDEFVLLCPTSRPTTATTPPSWPAGWSTRSASRSSVHTQSVRLSASVGIAFADEDGLTAEQLVARADAAMYAAKSAGRSRWATHSPHTVTAARAASRIESLLRESLDTGTFEVHYQPIHFLADRTITGRRGAGSAAGRRGWLRPPGRLHPRRRAHRSDQPGRRGGAAAGDARGCAVEAVAR